MLYIQLIKTFTKQISAIPRSWAIAASMAGGSQEDALAVKDVEIRKLQAELKKAKQEQWL